MNTPKLEDYISTSGQPLQRARIYMARRAWDSLIARSAAANIPLSLFLENLVLASIAPATQPLKHHSQR